MEGDGEGMVAIIRGLQDSGLSVTLTSGELPRTSIYATRNYAPQAASTNEPSNIKAPISTNNSAQACDDIYTSTYQMAHCNMRSSSPPILLKEFPMRKNSSNNDGNFQVGWERSGSGELPARSNGLRTAGTSTYKASFHFPYRGALDFDKRSSEAFAASLRRYSLSPVRSPGAELVQKLISSTLNKNATTAASAKMTRSSLKKRSDPDRQKLKDKDIQTYVRIRRKNKEGVDNAKSNSAKRMRLHSPVKDGRDKRFKDNQLNVSYDYLKSTSGNCYSKLAEVRYLSDVSKCIRETIKQIVEEQSSHATTCTQMQNRYLAHRKKCQHRASGSSKQTGVQAQPSSPEAKSTETMDSLQTCLPSCPFLAPRVTSCMCKKDLTGRGSKEEFGRQVSEKIAKWLLDVPAYANMSAGDKQKRVEMVEQLANAIVALKDDEDIEEKANREIEKILETLPMWLPSTKSERDEFKKQITDNLMNKLNKVFKGIDKLDEEVSKWIDEIPFKYRDSLGGEVDKDKIASMITDRLRPLKIDKQDDDEALRNEILDILNELPIDTVGKKEQYLDNLADKLTNVIKSIPVSELKISSVKGDEFDKKIAQWMKEIKFKKRDSLGQEVDKQKIAKIIADRLKYIALDRPEKDDDYREALKNEVKDILDDLPLEIAGSKEKLMEKLATKLTSTLETIPASKIQPVVDKIDETISQWIAGVKFKKQDSQGNLVDKHKIAHSLADRLKPLAINRPEDEDEYHELLKNEIVDILDELPIEIAGNKEQFVEKLASKLTNLIKKIPASEIKPKPTGDKFDNKIARWMDDLKLKKRDSQGNVVDKNKIAEAFSERLKSIASDRPEDDEEYQEVLKQEIIDFLDELPIEIKGDKEQFVEKQADRLINKIKKVPVSEIKPKSDKFDETISQLIKDVKFKKRDSQGNVVDKRKIADTFSERLKPIAIDRPEDDEEYEEVLRQEIVDALDEFPIEIKGDKEQFIDKLASKFTKVIKKIPTTDIKPKGDKFDEKISQWMGDIKFKKRDSQGNVVDKRKIADAFSERLKCIAVDRPDDDEEYHDVLKQEIVEALEELPIEIKGNKEQFIDKLANKLAHMVKKIPTDEIKPKRDKFDETITQWMGDIKFKKRDSKGNVVDKRKIVDTFSERLKSVAIDRPDDDEEYNEILKKEIIDILDTMPIEVKGNKEQFIDKLASKLTNTIKKIPTKEIKPKPITKNKIQEKIVDWLKDIPELSSIAADMKNKDNKKMIEKLIKKIQTLQSKGADSEDMDNEIQNWLQDILEQEGSNIDPKTKSLLSEKLVENLTGKPASGHKRRSNVDYKDECSEEIKKWLQNIPELSGSKEENNIMAEILAKRLQELQSRGVDDIYEIQDEIIDWLLVESEKKGLNLDVRAKDDLINQLARKIAKVKPAERFGAEIKDTINEEIWSGLKNILGIKESEKHKDLIKQLQEKVISMSEEHGEDVSEEDIQKEITRWLDKFVDRSGLDIDSEDRYKLLEDLTSKMKNILKPNAKYNDLKHSISDKISDILDNNTSKMSPKQKKNVQKKVSELLARTLDNIAWDDTYKLKQKLLKILEQETKVSPEHADKLAEAFINIAKEKSKSDGSVITGRRQPIKLEPTISKNVEEVIQDKLKNTLDDFEINNPKEVQNQLANLMEEQITKGLDTKSARKQIQGILKSTNLSKDEVNDLTRTLTLQTIDLSSHDDDAILPSEFTSAERDLFEESAQNDITEFIDDMTENMDPKYKRKVAGAAQKLAERLGNVISDPNKSMDDKVDILNDEVSNFLKSLSVPEMYGPLLAKQLQELAMSSTPHRSMQNFSFTPKRTSSAIGDNFTSTLEDIVQNWIHGLPVNIEDRSDARHIARDLANDIADRQKYLQSHPDIKQSEEEKLEFLKYQVFRALGKLVEGKELAKVINETASLLHQVKEIGSPLETSLTEEERVNEFNSAISQWVSDISDEMKQEYLDNNKKIQIVNDLADKILKKGKLGQNIDDEIIGWLTCIVRNTNQANIKNLSDNLKQRLIAKGLIKEIADATSQSMSGIQQDTNQFLEENLSSGVIDWLKSLPLYQRRTSNEKRIQESIVQDIVKDIQNLILSPSDETDFDVQILQMVKKHIEKFPMDKELKSDNAHIEKVAAQLVDYLNNMQLFDNISSRQSIHPLEYLVSTVNDWMNTIPIDSSNFDPKQIDEVKMNFLNRLNLLLKDSSQQNDQIIKDEIKRVLETLPIARTKFNDPKFINSKTEELFSRILGTPFLSKPSRPTINRDLVDSAVQDWSTKLPFQPGKSRNSVTDKIQNFTSDISNMLQNTKVTAVDNYKDNLLDKTVDFLKQLPIQNLPPDELKSLANELLKIIKNKAADLSPKPVSRSAADTLYDNIATWCDDLPISEGNTPEEKERVNTIKQNLASKLVNKIGELNMNPEIFNDDFLYNHLLQQEIDDLLNDLPPSPEITNNLPSIKENLMMKIREAKEKTKDELAGQTYKQQLRETISKSLPYDANLTPEGPESFEALVDNLADAYVDLHFITDNEEQKAKYKKKIADEITKYCNDYLKRHPETPIDPTKINQDLYNALKSIPTPKDEIIRSEAEHVRMKDEINDWIKDLPLTEGSGPQPAQKNKMASVLAKKLLEVEKEKEANPDMDYEEKAHKEISKLLKKLPIKPGKEEEVDFLVRKLIDKLKDTEQSRRISASTTKKSIDLIPDISDVTDTSGAGSSAEDQLCPCHRKYKHKISSKHICPIHKSPIPKSTLSIEDKAHLERIRLRSSLPTCRLHRAGSCKDASVNPCPIDTASQTDVCPNASNICPRSMSPRISPCPQEVSPQVIIKEYLWDSENSKLLGPVYRLPCLEVDGSSASVPSLHRPLQKCVSIQPSPCATPCQKKFPCPPGTTTPKPCINLRSPCISPRQSTAPKPCINLPRTVIPSLSSHCENRSVNTVPCEPIPQSPCPAQDIPYCSTPRRPMWQRTPCFPPSFSKPCSPNDTESDAGASRCFPRVINLGSFNDDPKPRRRSDYNDCQDFRRRIYRMPKPCVDVTRCCKCQNRIQRNMCRQRVGTPCQSSENVRLCSKCCGMPCPHPTRLFFR
ncbi:uncharacterized protein LOC128681357 [Plodia interpunctella]|uniref:uncharacterized protein LOC128681357 n=1 Tax=Plodia interpunctella TaxID=58824 RepID=UPI00236832D7|nr:uncharacterized protein LOC128681357 [Plodia interpunctella]